MLLNQMEEGSLTDIGEIEPVDDASTYAFPELFEDSDEEQGSVSKASPRGSMGSNRSRGSHRGSHRQSMLRLLRTRGRGSLRERSSRWCRGRVGCKWRWPTTSLLSRVDDQTHHPDNVEPFSVSPMACVSIIAET